MILYDENIDLSIGNKILLFSTDWCPDCIMLNQYIDQVIEENKDWEFIYVNTDKLPDIASKYEVFGIPSFIGFINGEKVGDLISKEAKPKSLINSWIKTLGIIEYDK